MNCVSCRISWIALNVLAVLGLIAAVILLLVDLGFWSMTYTPIHLVVFVVILLLILAIVAVAVVMVTGLKKGGSKGNYTGVRS